MKMAEAFSRQCDLVLSVSDLHIKPPALWEYYGIRSPFDIEILGDPRFRPKTLFTLPSVFKCVLKHHPDIIYVREEYIGWILSFFFKNFIYEMLDYLPRFSKLYRRLVTCSLKTVVISEGLKRRAVDAGLPAEKFIVCADGVDPSTFDICLSKKEARKRVGLAEDGRFILYAGRFTEWRGIPTLIESAQYLTDSIRIIF